MKKVFFLNSPGNLNVGNEFINVGARYLIKDILSEQFKDSYEFYESEFWERSSSLDKGTGYDWNTPEMIEKINQSDLVVISGGSIVSSYSELFLEAISKLKPPKILLGAGMYFYNDEEKEIAQRILSKFELVVTRDTPLYDAIKDNNTSAINGIEMAFFINNTYNLPKVDGKYAVVNIDFHPLRIFKLFKKYRELKKEFNSVYITENTSTDHKKQNFIFLSRWSEFCNLYANASFVSTMRIHTVVLCLLYGVPFEYIGTESKKREKLFEQFGMTLEIGKRYSREELLIIRDKMEKKKEKVRVEVSREIKNLLS